MNIGELITQACQEQRDRDLGKGWLVLFQNGAVEFDRPIRMRDKCDFIPFPSDGQELLAFVERQGGFGGQAYP